MKTTIRDARMTLAAVLSVLIAACGGGGGDEGSTPGVPDGGGPPPPPPPVASYSLIDDQEKAYRFLATAGFGGNSEDIDALVGRDAAEWVAEQIAIPYAPYLDRVLPLMSPPPGSVEPRSDRRHQLDMFWDAAITGDDQLRQRMLFALSQIIVANVTGRQLAHRESYYLDNLGKHAFGNYRDILQDITYTPLMAQYLTYRNNRKGDPQTGRLPDENYAREILQLFSIGLVELELNGEPRLEDGKPIETFDNDDIVNLARVFTGFRINPSNPATGWTRPLQILERNHSELEKRFLGAVIPAGTDGATTVNLALDAIFEHPNVAPFISRQLIQRFTASNPSPDYVLRVAEAFEQGTFTADNARVFGSGIRGDLEATVAAILLDPSLFDAVAVADDKAGKIREPVLRFVHWARAFKLDQVDSSNEVRLRRTESASRGLGQRPFGSPSVFNFYRPGYIAPDSAAGDQGLTTPEFQIVNESSAIGFANFMADYIVDAAPNNGNNTFVPNYNTELALADDADALVDHLALLLTGNQISEPARQGIVEAIESIGIRGAEEGDDRLARVHLAVILFVNDSSFTIIN